MFSEDWAAYIEKGDLEFLRKHYTLAQENYEEALKLAPEKSLPYEKLGNFYYYSNRLELGFKHLIKAFELGSSSPMVFFNLGRIYFLGQELLDRGRYFFDRALALSPKNEPLIGTYLGVLFYLKGRVEDAGDFLSRYRLSTPLKEPLDFFLGCISHDLGVYEKAVKSFNHALSFDPKSEETFLMLGNSYFKMKNYKDALNSYQKAVELSPHYSSAWKNAATAFQYLGDPVKAGEAIKNASALKKKSREKFSSAEEPGLDRHLWQHTEKLLLAWTLSSSDPPLVLD
jgi:tetratricopeptide (TPR) repeat protein